MQYPIEAQVSYMYSGQKKIEISKAWIIIRDAHCNYPAQQAISKIIRWLVNDEQIKLRLVTVEGSHGPIDTSSFRSYQNSKIRNDVANHYMKDGKITGPEFEAITGETGFELYGVDNDQIWTANKDAYLSLLDIQGDALKFCKENRILIENIKETIKKHSRPDHFEKLCDFDRFARYEVEMGNGFSSANILRLYHYALHNSIDVHAYRELEKYVQWREDQSTLNISVLLEQCKYVLSAVYDRLLNCENEPVQKWIYILRVFLLIEKMLNINLNSDEWMELDGQKAGPCGIFLNPLQAAAISNKISAYISQHGIDSTHVDHRRKAFDDGIVLAQKFYELASQRSSILFDTTEQKKNESKAEIVCLVTGGFHTDRISRLLRSGNIAHIVFTPRFKSTDDNKYRETYKKIMKDEKTSIEKFFDGE